MTKAVGFIGLGVMGFPMAGHLSQHNRIAVFNRTKTKSDSWAENHNGKICYSLEELAKLSEIIILCIGNDNDVRNVITGHKGLLDNLKPGSIIVDHTTTSAKLASELYELLNSKDISYLDAPVSGGDVGAVAGNLVVMIGGETKAVEHCVPIMECYSAKCQRMGGPTAGQHTKCVNQIMIGSTMIGLCESLIYAHTAGL